VPLRGLVALLPIAWVTASSRGLSSTAGQPSAANCSCNLAEAQDQLALAAEAAEHIAEAADVARDVAARAAAKAARSEEVEGENATLAAKRANIHLLRERLAKYTHMAAQEESKLRVNISHHFAELKEIRRLQAAQRDDKDETLPFSGLMDNGPSGAELDVRIIDARRNLAELEKQAHDWEQRKAAAQDLTERVNVAEQSLDAREALQRLADRADDTAGASALTMALEGLVDRANDARRAAQAVELLAVRQGRTVRELWFLQTEYPPQTQMKVLKELDELRGLQSWATDYHASRFASLHRSSKELGDQVPDGVHLSIATYDKASLDLDFALQKAYSFLDKCAPVKPHSSHHTSEHSGGNLRGGKGPSTSTSPSTSPQSVVHPELASAKKPIPPCEVPAPSSSKTTTATTTMAPSTAPTKADATTTTLKIITDTSPTTTTAPPPSTVPKMTSTSTPMAEPTPFPCVPQGAPTLPPCPVTTSTPTTTTTITTTTTTTTTQHQQQQ